MVNDNKKGKYYCSLLLHILQKRLTLWRVFHGIRLLRLRKIGCRETINLLLFYNNPSFFLL